MRHICAVLIALSGTAASLAGDLTPPFGAPSPTMKSLQQVEPRTLIGSDTTPGDGDALFKITSPGSYYVGSSVSASSGRAVLEIAASNVTVDFSGFRAQGMSGSIDGVFTTGAISNITLLNGNFVSFGGDGIDTSTATQVRIEGTRVRGCAGVGIRAGASTVITDCESAANGSHGIVVGADAVVQDCTSIGSTGGDGLRIIGAGARVQRVTASQNAGGGIAVAGTTGARISELVARGNGGTGVSLTAGCVMVDSTVGESASNGVQLFENARISRCTITESAQNGVSLAGNAVVENCQIANNAGNGIFIFFTAGILNAYAQIIGNTINNNGTDGDDWGIRGATGTFSTLVDSNILRYNRGGISLPGNGSNILRNHSGPNFGDGYDLPGQNDVGTIRIQLDQMTKPTDNYDGGILIIVGP